MLLTASKPLRIQLTLTALVISGRIGRLNRSLPNDVRHSHRHPLCLMAYTTCESSTEYTGCPHSRYVAQSILWHTDICSITCGLFSVFTPKQVLGPHTAKFQPIWIKCCILLYGIHLQADLDSDQRVDGSRPNKNDCFFCNRLLVMHPKSYIETTDHRDFGGKP